MATDFKSQYGMDYEQYINLYNEASAADPRFAGLNGFANAASSPGGAGARLNMSFDENNAGSNIALWNAMKAKDKRLFGDDGGISSAPTIDGVTVFGSMNEDMRNAKGGRWEYTGSRYNGDYAGTTGDGVSRGDPNVEAWTFRADPVAQPQENPGERMPDDPKPSGPTIYDSWDDYIRIAREETEGMNRMPFVGPNWQKGNPTYGDVPYNPEYSLEMFYPAAINDYRARLRDPLDGEQLTPFAG